jgi:2-oxoglutarate ferredoxin oxidoreductase subunit beta
MIEAAHGRPPAVASAMKRLLPDRLIFSYQGDGDLAAIGTAEIIHAANRGENFTVFFINNATYGMTGGQMAPTTICDQKTATTPSGRQQSCHGHPLNVASLINATAGCLFIARGALNSVAHISQSRMYIKKALQVQMQCGGFSFVELLSPCPTAWGKTPLESLDWIENALVPIFPLGVLKDNTHAV